MKKISFLFLFSFLFSGCTFWDNVLRDRYDPYKFIGVDGNKVLVKFYFENFSAGEVWLVGDFNQWNADPTDFRYPEAGLDQNPVIELEKNEQTEMWSVVIPLEVGYYNYMYVLDGGRVTVHDPNADTTSDGFGGLMNSIVVVK